MNRRRSLENNLKEHSKNVGEKYKVFKDIRKYFSEKEWAKLGNSEKIIYVYMKRNYDVMTSLGLTAHLPSFMRPKYQNRKSPKHDSNEARNSDYQKFPDTSGVSQDTGNVYQQRRTLPSHLRSEEHPQEATTIQPRKHLKLSLKSEEPQSLSPCTDCLYHLRMSKMLPVKEASEDNDMKPVPVSPDSEPAQKQLCPPGNPISIKQCMSTTGSRKWKTNVWVHRLKERKNYVVYEEISDPEEEDD
ncbi:protein SSX4-like [Molossus molossus]|uniref:protein SSX4-like n=1 Tax=Molossus molossus TaxID=27622 RepID=UPI001745E118|nr:protein SSX4-like [Molossus molossus]